MCVVLVFCRARPEVMTVGLKSVRELCLRCPLVMNPELLQVRGCAGGGVMDVCGGHGVHCRPKGLEGVTATCI